MHVTTIPATKTSPPPPMPPVSRRGAKAATATTKPAIRLHRVGEGERRNSLREGAQALQMVIAAEESNLRALRKALRVANAANDNLAVLDDPSVRATLNRGLEVLYHRYDTEAVPITAEPINEAAERAYIALGRSSGDVVRVSGGNSGHDGTTFAELRGEYVLNDIAKYGIDAHSDGDAVARLQGAVR